MKTDFVAFEPLSSTFHVVCNLLSFLINLVTYLASPAAEAETESGVSYVSQCAGKS